MFVGGEHSPRCSKLLRVPFPLVPFFAASAGGIESIDVRGVRNVQLVRVDAYNWSILTVQIADVKCVLAPKDDIVVELIPAEGVRQCIKASLSQAPGS